MKVFCLFVGIEMKLRRHLLCLFKTNANIKMEDVIEDIIHNDNVLFRWTAVTSDLDDEDLTKELLQHIVELWVYQWIFCSWCMDGVLQAAHRKYN